jgi:hypothetical protein
VRGTARRRDSIQPPTGGVYGQHHPPPPVGRWRGTVRQPSTGRVLRGTTRQDSTAGGGAKVSTGTGGPQVQSRPSLQPHSHNPEQMHSFAGGPGGGFGVGVTLARSRADAKASAARASASADCGTSARIATTNVMPSPL